MSGRKRYIAVGNKWVPMEEYSSPEPQGPMVIGALKPFISMLDGKEVTSRQQYASDLRAHRMIEVGDQTHHFNKPKPDNLPGVKAELIRQVNQKLRY